MPHLPDLTGSEKQIAWATTIRAECLKALDTLEASINLAPNCAQRVAALAAVAAARAQTSARCWIDCRDERFDLRWLHSQGVEDYVNLPAPCYTLSYKDSYGKHLIDSSRPGEVQVGMTVRLILRGICAFDVTGIVTAVKHDKYGATAVILQAGKSLSFNTDGGDDDRAVQILGQPAGLGPRHTSNGSAV